MGKNLTMINRHWVCFRAHVFGKYSRLQHIETVKLDKTHATVYVSTPIQKLSG